MAPPLAGVLLFLAFPASAGAPCPVPYEPAAPAGAQYEAGSPVCTRAQSFLPFIEKLVKNAGLPPVRVTLDPNLQRNAHYEAGRVSINHGILGPSQTEQDLRYILAHEVGHGVQYPRPEGAERRRLAAIYNQSRSEADREVFLAFSRRYEGQADAIALELLSRLGYSDAYARGGVEGFFTCAHSGAMPAGVGTHPHGGRRVVNSTLGERFFTDTKTRVSAGDGAGAFDGASARAGGPDPGVVVPYRPASFHPTARIEDFNNDGTLLPGRLAYARFGRLGEVPQPLGPARPARHVYDLERVLAPAYIAMVNELATGPGVEARIMLACGGKSSESLAEEFGPASWSERVARSLTMHRP